MMITTSPVHWRAWLARCAGTVRYGMVSGLCLVLNVTLIPVMNAHGIHYALATFIAFWVLAVVGYGLHCVWTFRSKPSFAMFVRYVSAMAMNLPLSIGLIGLGHDILGVSVAFATTAATLLLVAWNFIAVRWAVVRKG